MLSRCWTSLVQSLISTTEINCWQLHQTNSMEFTVDDLRYNLLNVILYCILIVLYIIKLIITASIIKGQAKKKFNEMGFQKPSTVEQQSVIAKITKAGDNMYCVPSISKDDQTYLVDMESGFCECRTCMNGSPCKHQYILWVNKVSTAVNFLPIFSKEQRQMYADIAIGI